MKCLNCGNELPDGALFCDNCGQKTEQINDAPKQTSEEQSVLDNNKAKKFCVNCGAEIEIGTEFCGNCGTPTQPIVTETKNSIFCGNCGAEISAGAEFCGNCGITIKAAYNNSPKTPVKRKKVLPIIIITVLSITLLFGGAFAAYKFYFSDRTEETDVSTNTSVPEQITEKQKPDANEPNSTATIVPTEQPQQPQTQPPVFTYATASGIRSTDTEGGQYSIDAVLSPDKTTKWAPTKESNGGVSEWIQINASEMQCVNGILILNGYHKSDEVWENNNRVKDCTISFSDGQSKTVTLDDTMDLIKIDLDKPVNTTYIRLTINSLYSGTKWNDTAITYLSAY